MVAKDYESVSDLFSQPEPQDGSSGGSQSRVGVIPVKACSRCSSEFSRWTGHIRSIDLGMLQGH